MAKASGAGDLFHRVAFEAPVAGSDGAGGVLAGFAERCIVRAEFIHIRGGEGVLAARLESKHPQVIRVRAMAATLAASADWRIVDKRTGVIFNIRDISLSADRVWLDFLCESGVAS